MIKIFSRNVESDKPLIGPMVFMIIPVLVAVSCGLLLNCGGTSQSQQLDIPLDMPEVCRGVDFNLDVEMREICGVKVRTYRSYKNISEFRLLTNPKGGKIVKKGDVYELRLPDMVPTELPSLFKDKIDFSENSTGKYLQSQWEYHETLDRGSQKRIKVMRIDIPLMNGRTQSVCYAIHPRPKKVSRVQEGYYTNQLTSLACSDFNDMLKR